MRLAFVGGVHGAGKTVLCRAVAPLLGAIHLSAGSVIRDVLGRPGGFGAKPVADVVGDQEALLAGLARLRQGRVLLDGHFCLLRPSGVFEQIPMNVFARMRPRALAVVIAAPALIVDRLGSRDGMSYDVAQVAAFQQAETTHAAGIAAALSIPFLSCDGAGDPEEVVRFLERHLMEG